jgi:hypothetical protein
MTLLITVLVLGVLGSLSPTTIVVFILLLATTRARVNAAASADLHHAQCLVMALRVRDPSSRSAWSLRSRRGRQVRR